VTFNIGWFVGGGQEYPDIEKFLTSLAIRPLLRPEGILDVSDGDFLSHSSRPIPCVTFLHELTHLLLRMDFILTHPEEWSPRRIENEKEEFEAAYQKWIVSLLSTIHPDFSKCIAVCSSNENEKALASLYQTCWGGRDEIFVIIGVKLSLEGQEYVLGETRLLRAIAQQKGLPPSFIGWSHDFAFFADDPDLPIIKPRSFAFSEQLWNTHHEAFRALFHDLGWDDILPAPSLPHQTD
jgi:hypothetical protein